jgi:hypothetical protein
MAMANAGSLVLFGSEIQGRQGAGAGGLSATGRSFKEPGNRV